MENTNIENLDSTNEEASNEEFVDEAVEDASDEATEETDTSVSKEEYEKLKKEKDELYIQLKKAKAAKEQSKAEAPTRGELSTKDVLYLAKADIHEDDMDEVLDWSKFKKVSVNEAHKQLKGVLRERDEERKTASATNTGTARRASSKISDDALTEKASKGELPDSEDEMARLWRIRHGKA